MNFSKHTRNSLGRMNATEKYVHKPRPDDMRDSDEIFGKRAKLEAVPRFDPA